MFKKIISFVIIVAFISITFSTFWYTSSQLEAANSLAVRSTIKDHKATPKDYNLDSNVLRQEIALISRRVSGFKENTSCKNTFSDISTTIPNTWICKNVESLVDNNLISKNSSFRPEDSITKSEALIMFIRSIGFDFKIKDVKNWQKEVVDFAVNKWVVKNFIDYNALAKRWWIFEIANFSIVVKEEEVKKGIWKGRTMKKYSDEAIIN